LSCENHPNVEAIANCSDCDTPMCGLCANYIEEGVYCESCVSNRETEQIVAEKLQRQNKGAIQKQVTELGAENAEAARKGGQNSQLIQVLIIVACLLFLTVRLFLNSGSPDEQANSELPVAEFALVSLVQCMLIFEEIGEILQSNNTPDPALRCDQTAPPNIITRNGDDIKISHPDPGVYGVEELSVSKSNPVSTLIY
jgi:hypothetical protein